MGFKFIIVILFLSLSPLLAAEESFLEKILKKQVAESVEIAGKEISFVVKSGASFGFKENNEVSLKLRGPEQKKFILESGKVTIFRRHYVIEISPVKGEKNTFIVNERIDLRSFGKELTSTLVKFRVAGEKIVKVSEKIETEDEVRARLEGGKEKKG